MKVNITFKKQPQSTGLARIGEGYTTEMKIKKKRFRTILPSCNCNMSFNHDIEGHTTDKSVLAAREEHKAWLMRQLMTSKGHKLLLAGDEFGNTHTHSS